MVEEGNEGIHFIHMGIQQCQITICTSRLIEITLKSSGPESFVIHDQIDCEEAKHLLLFHEIRQDIHETGCFYFCFGGISYQRLNVYYADNSQSSGKNDCRTNNMDRPLHSEIFGN